MGANMVEFFPSSDIAVQKAETPVKRGGLNAKYPWRELPVGKSFAVGRNEIKESSLRSLAYKTGRRLGMRFVVVTHSSADYDCYEVARIK